MHRILVFLIVLIATQTFAQLDHPNLRLATHQSEAVGREMTYRVYVPSTDDSEERFPVVYLLHGKTTSHDAWPRHARAAEAADRYRCILVFVGGAEYSWYLDSPVMPESQFFTYITDDLVDHIDSKYPTVARREGRAIMGLSMGGHGALLAAARRPDLFVSASSLSGVLKISDHPDRESIVERLGSFEEYPDRWAENSVHEHAEEFVDADVRLLFDCGEDDTAGGILSDNHKMHARLKELGVAHIWREHPGGHTWSYWREHLQEHLNFHAAAMSSVQEQRKWTQHYFDRMSLFFEENADYELESPDEETVRVCLFGSSGIEGLDEDLLPATLTDGTPLRFFNRGISSDRLGIDQRGLSRRMEVSVFDFEPQVVVIANGTNDIGELHRSDVGHPTIDRMAEEYERIVSTIRSRLPETKVIAVACAPVRGRFSHLNESLVEYNERLKLVAVKYGCDYVDIHAAVVGEDGLVKEEYSTDGLHFTREAKGIWVQMISTAISGAL